MNVYDTKQAAKLLGVHPVTLRNLAIEGKIPCRKVGREWRFHEAHLTDWLAGGNSKRKSAGEEEWASSREGMSGGFASPRRTEQEYANLLGLDPDEMRKSTNQAGSRNSGESTSSATSPAGSGRKQ